MRRSGRILGFPARRSVERHDEARPEATHGSRLIDQCRIWHCQREDGRVGSLNAEARQPRVDGRAGDLSLVLDAEFERGRILRGAGLDGQGGAFGSQGSRVRAL